MLKKMQIIKEKKWESITLIVYMILLATIMSFHEIWFDEAQAWLISQDSLKEILFNVPHYEGHPPFWYLILMPFSHAHMPVEFSLKFVNFIFITLAVALIIYKAPFSKAVRLSLPFTYFLFYQYGVTSRPYSILALGFVLSAITYKTRNEKPFLFIFSLMLLPMSCPYGILISTGIVIAWFLEVWDRQNIFEFVKKFIKDKRFFAMLLMALLCLILVIMISPMPDTFAFANRTHKITIESILSFFELFFVFPMDALIGNLYMQYINIITLKIKYILLGIILGIFIILGLSYITKICQKFKIFAIPYFMMMYFFSSVYVFRHHIGIIYLFFLFVLWVCFDDENIYKLSDKFRSILKMCLVVILGVQIAYTVLASFNEINLAYYPSREIAKYIKENNIDKYNIFASLSKEIYCNDKKIYNYKFAKEFDEMMKNNADKKLMLPGNLYINDVLNFNRLEYGITIKSEDVLKNNYEEFEILAKNLHLDCLTKEIIKSEYIKTPKNIYYLKTNPLETSINAYFDKNIFCNFNTDTQKRYTDHEGKTFEEIYEIQEKDGLKCGVPDFIVNQYPLKLAFPNQNIVLERDYRVIKEFSKCMIWKNTIGCGFSGLYIRNDLYEDYVNKTGKFAPEL